MVIGNRRAVCIINTPQGYAVTKPDIFPIYIDAEYEGDITGLYRGYVGNMYGLRMDYQWEWRVINFAAGRLKFLVAKHTDRDTCKPSHAK